MSKGYTRMKCVCCGKSISNNGLGRTSHYRKHVREGLMKEEPAHYIRMGLNKMYRVPARFTVIERKVDVQEAD